MCQYCQGTGEHGLDSDYVRRYIKNLKMKLDETGDENTANEILRAEDLLHSMEAEAAEA